MQRIKERSDVVLFLSPDIIKFVNEIWDKAQKQEISIIKPR